MNTIAKTVAVVVSDDLDGSAEATTVSFGLDGTAYEVDLSEKNRAKLERVMAPYIQAGRRINRSRGRAGVRRQSAGRSDRADIRAWAKDNGLVVSERGRISAEIMEKYQAAH
jgi:Spy/CpxP family protein refolding chaperone